MSFSASFAFLSTKISFFRHSLAKIYSLVVISLTFFQDILGFLQDKIQRISQLSENMH